MKALAGCPQHCRYRLLDKLTKTGVAEFRQCRASRGPLPGGADSQNHVAFGRVLTLVVAVAGHHVEIPVRIAGSGGTSCRYTGPGRHQVGTGPVVGPVPQATANLGRWGLRQQIGTVGQYGRRLDLGTGVTSSTAMYLPGAAPAVGRGAHLRLVEPATAPEQRLRGIVRNYRNLDVHLNDRLG